jgi:hypothetical protein
VCDILSKMDCVKNSRLQTCPSLAFISIFGTAYGVAPGVEKVFNYLIRKSLFICDDPSISKTTPASGLAKH